MSISVCYIDEAGCTGVLPANNSPIQPILIISALILDSNQVDNLTLDFLALKSKYFPSMFKGLTHDLDGMMVEIKGAEIKKGLRSGSKKRRKHHQRFMDDLFNILEAVDAKLISRIWIKGIGQKFNGRAIYTTTAQQTARLFQNYLQTHQQNGIMIGDFRQPKSNSYVSHSVFTQKYKKKWGVPLNNLIEVPTFGISDNHAGLQIVDLITSAILCPVATYVYCSGIVINVHVNPNDKYILERYKGRLKRIQYSPKINGKMVHGISVNDPHAGKTSAEIFK